MGVPNGTGADWLVVIEWQMELGHNSAIRRRHAYVLSGPLLFPSVSHLFFAPCLRIQPPISQLQLPPARFFLICHFLLLSFQVW